MTKSKTIRIEISTKKDKVDAFREIRIYINVYNTYNRETHSINFSFNKVLAYKNNSLLFLLEKNNKEEAISYVSGDSARELLAFLNNKFKGEVKLIKKYLPVKPPESKHSINIQDEIELYFEDFYYRSLISGDSKEEYYNYLDCEFNNGNRRSSFYIHTEDKEILSFFSLFQKEFVKKTLTFNISGHYIKFN